VLSTVSVVKFSIVHVLTNRSLDRHCCTVSVGIAFLSSVGFNYFEVITASLLHHSWLYSSNSSMPHSAVSFTTGRTLLVLYWPQVSMNF